MLKGKLFGRKQKPADTLQSVLGTWTLSDFQFYVTGQNKNFRLDESGLLNVIEHLCVVEKPSASFPGGKRYVEPTDNDARIKKLLDLFLAVGKSPKLSVEAVEALHNAITLFADVIGDYDTRHKQIYADRLKEQLLRAVDIVEAKQEIVNRLDLL